MDNRRVGALIAERRKEKGLTQKELGARLHVSDRAVSKWERGLNLPDAALFEPLCRELELTVTAEVSCAASEDGLYLPQWVRVSGPLAQGEQERLTQLILEDLGIPAERQTYDSGEELP